MNRSIDDAPQAAKKASIARPSGWTPVPPAATPNPRPTREPVIDATVLLDHAALAAAAFAAGAVNAIAGGGTLITFPVLIALGFDLKVANATSTVALWPGALGGAWGYRRELDDAPTRRWLRRLALPSLAGGAAGAALVIFTPASAFEALVPWLVLVATALFALQARLKRWLGSGAATRGSTHDATHRSRAGAAGLFAAQLAVSVYGGYFGAGMGILLLTVLGLMGIADLHRANGMKNILGMLINGVAVVGFAVGGLVSWPAALVMAAAGLLGGYAGAALARRIGAKVVRVAIITLGFAVGVVLLVRVHG